MTKTAQVAKRYLWCFDKISNLQFRERTEGIKALQVQLIMTEITNTTSRNFTQRGTSGKKKPISEKTATDPGDDGVAPKTVFKPRVH